jgi:hypothetical protein
MLAALAGVSAAALLLVVNLSAGAPKTRAAGPNTGHSAAAPASTAAARRLYDAKMKEASAAAQRVFVAKLAVYAAGTAAIDDVVYWSERAAAVGEWPQSREAHRDRMRRLEKEVRARVQAGTSPAADEHVAAFHRASAEATAP